MKLFNLQKFAAIFLIAVFLNPTAGFCASILFSPPASFYAPATTVGEMRMYSGDHTNDPNNASMITQPGQTDKLKFIIPPGVSLFGVSTTVQSIGCYGNINGTPITGTYFKSYQIDSTSSGINTSSPPGGSFLNAGSTHPAVLRHTETTTEMAGYITINNQCSVPHWIMGYGVMMKISDIGLFNAWVSDGGMGGATIGGGTYGGGPYGGGAVNHNKGLCTGSDKGGFHGGSC